MTAKRGKTEGKEKASRSERREAACVSGEPERYLNDKELTFCIEYSVSNNATQAYQKAYKCGYNTARSAGCLLLRDIAISSTIDQMKRERLERLKVDKDDVIRKINILATYDASEFFDDDGRLKPLSELHPDQRFVIEGMDVSERITGEEGDGLSRLMKIKLPSKRGALELLAKHLQLLNEKPKEDNGDIAEAARAFAEAMARSQTP